MLYVSLAPRSHLRSSLGSRYQLCSDYWTYDNSSAIGVDELFALGIYTKLRRL